MKKADQKIVLENPGATPHELLLKGLSEGAFQEVVSAQIQQGQATMQANRIEVETPKKLKPQMPSNIIQPIVSTSGIPAHLNTQSSAKIRVRAKGAGGVGTLVSAESAKRMLRRGGYEQC